MEWKNIDKMIYILFVVMFVVGIFVGQFVGYYRAWTMYQPSVHKYNLERITANLEGNTSHIYYPYACVQGEPESVLKFYKEILEPSYYGKDVCFSLS